VTGSGPVAEVQLLVQDGTVDVANLAGARAGRETKRLRLPADGNDRFLDGPACRRLAVVDFDPATGRPMPPPARFVPSRRAGGNGSYRFDGEPASAATLAVNAFGTAFQTIHMFEGPDALGRRVTWAFGSEQLLVVPRAGEWANAFYERASRSLQFFWFPAQDGAPVYTALSRDIVSHECGHALLDAVVPSLYDSGTPESIAIHESVADLVAVLMALDSDVLRIGVLERSGNSLAGPNAFNGIAEEFGMARPGADGMQRRALRDLDTRATRESLAGARPHVLSSLLSAIYYDTLASIFMGRFEDERRYRRPVQAANRALGTAHLIFRRLLLRGIDYLPPGELSFADVGRATMAADRAAWADADATDEVLARRRDFAMRFVDRLIVRRTGDLDSPRPAELDLPPSQLPGLRDSDYVAYEYVGRHRDTLGIPAGTPFTVLPRVDATKRVGPVSVPPQRELILKVGWNHVEPTSAVPGATSRLVPTGVTISFHWETGRCLALVASDVTSRRQRRARDELVTRLAADGMLGDGVGLAVSGGVASLTRSHRLLHLEGWDQ
jgi:hypothetical protein